MAHTHAIFKFGLDQLLPDSLEFVHGPGCPVCVLPMGRIDSCLEIAAHPEVIFCTYGDAMRVPGRNGSLLDARRRGADIRVVYSPLDALQLAADNPQREVVFFGLGFETTMPASALTLQQARQRQLKNFTLFCQHYHSDPHLTQPVAAARCAHRRLPGAGPRQHGDRQRALISLSLRIIISRWW
ncbi:Hydrogenase isoenzymes formation protein hypD [Serratia fonticola]|uniref:Hydrogenase isoenzymes formation protein hypD n=1 Tax=Serratia fonticola TaxID=47917 RepID=A0A4U9THL0_SERFO|nr:Hydrogenase isoenzymes formation protein hypD [Serratia fonticola]